jgi:hypothetical protein
VAWWRHASRRRQRRAAVLRCAQRRSGLSPFTQPSPPCKASWAKGASFCPAIRDFTSQIRRMRTRDELHRNIRGAGPRRGRNSRCDEKSTQAVGKSRSQRLWIVGSHKACATSGRIRILTIHLRPSIPVNSRATSKDRLACGEAQRRGGKQLLRSTCLAPTRSAEEAHASATKGGSR